MYDVVVLGAGPTGCYAARQLARMGYEVLVLEEHPQIGEPVHCTGIIGLEAYERFELDPTCVEAYLTGVRFLSPAGQSFRVPCKEARAVVVDRSRFDQMLGQEALAAGSSFLLGTRAERITVKDDAAVVSAHCLREPISLRSSLVMVATGADDAITREAGLAEPSGRPMFGAQLLAHTGDLDEVEVHLGPSIAPGGFAWAVPANGHGCRVGLVCQSYPRPLLNRFARRLEQRGAISRNGSRIRCRAVPSGPRLPSYADRILVIGDAAGQVKATTCGGIYYGLLGAEAAVAAADRALRLGDAGSGHLAQYEDEWLRRIGSEQRTGRLLRRVLTSLSNRDMEALFWFARRTRLPHLLSRLPFDWHTSGLLTILWRDLFGAATRGSRAAVPTSRN